MVAGRILVPAAVPTTAEVGQPGAIRIENSVPG